MRLTAAQLAQLALDVGWRGDDVAQAVALALATSEGDPGWHSGSRPNRGIRYWGLWGIDLDTYPRMSVFDLTLAGRNAQCAYALWSTHGPGWDWSPVWSGEAWRERLGEAQRASLEPRRTVPIGDQGATEDLQQQAQDARRELGGAAGSRELTGEPPPVTWPPHQF